MKLTNEHITQYRNRILLEDKDPNVIYLLIEHMTGYYKTELLMLNSIEIDNEKLSKYVEDYCKGKSVQYITNYTYFLNRKFFVDERVLIPRFETEEVVQFAIDVIKENGITNICEVGTGSGVIGITLNLECDVDVVATDISLDALEVAQINQKQLKSNVEFLHADVLGEVDESIEMIVSNPPYIKTGGFVSEETLYNEPKLALFGGSDGLYFYRKIHDELSRFKNVKHVVFEIGYDQGDDIKQLFSNYDVSIIKDINNNDRIAYIKEK